MVEHSLLLLQHSSKAEFKSNGIICLVENCVCVRVCVFARVCDMYRPKGSLDFQKLELDEFVSQLTGVLGMEFRSPGRGQVVLNC